MTGRILDIDHLMVSVADTERTGETFARMGFTMTPKSGLPGMSNRLICFAPPADDRCNFIEFLSLEDPALAPKIMSDILLPAERPVSMVMVSGDVATCARDLAAKGLEVAAPWALKRDWTLPSGEVISPQFVVAIPTIGQAPVYWNVVEYVTPEHYRRREFLGHRNSARRFAAVLAVAADPASVADHYRHYWNARIADDGEGGCRIALDNVWLSVMTPAAAAARYPEAALPAESAAARLTGFVVEVADMATLRDCLEAGGFMRHEDGQGGLWVSPAEAHGAVVHFVPEGTVP